MNCLVARASSPFLSSFHALKHDLRNLPPTPVHHCVSAQFLFLSLSSLFFTGLFCRFGHFVKMKIIQRHRRAILAPVSIVILLCGCTDLVSSRSRYFGEMSKNDTDFASTDCERVKPFFESKNITLVITKEPATENSAKSK